MPSAATAAAVMQLPPNATLADAPALLKELQQTLEAGGNEAVRMDATALRNFDTSALALLMHARRLAMAGGRAFHVVGAPPKLAQLAALYGVEELVGLATPSAEPPAPAGPAAVA